MKLPIKITLALLSIILLVQFGCKKEKEAETVGYGKTKIAVDESLKPVITAILQSHKMHYPKTTIEPIIVSEQEAVKLLLNNDSVQIAAITRELTPNEQTYFTQRHKKYQPAPMALDAVVLVSNLANRDTTLSLDELKNVFNTKNGPYLIFDSSNSSNFNAVKKALALDTVINENIFGLKGNLDVIEEIKKHKNAIGFVGYNWISDVDDDKVSKIKQEINIMAIGKTNDGPFYKPKLSTLKARQYPLERIIYLHTTENRWGVAMGFIRFACSQIGQLVIEKEDLLPFYIIPKEYILEQ